MLWMEILKVIEGEVSIIDISRKSSTSYSHTFNIINDLESKNILTVKKEGRNSIIMLTPKGERVAKLLKLLEEDLNG